MAITQYIPDPQVLGAAAALQGVVVPALTRRIIRAATATLPAAAAAPVALSVFMVPAAGNADATTVMISGRPIAPGESYPCPELIGQGLGAGGSMQALGNGLVFKFTATDFV
jgi:hypothetical protein